MTNQTMLNLLPKEIIIQIIGDNKLSIREKVLLTLINKKFLTVAEIDYLFCEYVIKYCCDGSTVIDDVKFPVNPLFADFGYKFNKQIHECSLTFKYIHKNVSVLAICNGVYKGLHNLSKLQSLSIVSNQLKYTYRFPKSIKDVAIIDTRDVDEIHIDVPLEQFECNCEVINYLNVKSHIIDVKCVKKMSKRTAENVVKLSLIGEDNHHEYPKVSHVIFNNSGFYRDPIDLSGFINAKSISCLGNEREPMLNTISTKNLDELTISIWDLAFGIQCRSIGLNARKFELVSEDECCEEYLVNKRGAVYINKCRIEKFYIRKVYD